MNNVKFSIEWLEKRKKEQGRTFVWISKQLGMSPHLFNYKKRNNCFTYKEEDIMIKLLSNN